MSTLFTKVCCETKSLIEVLSLLHDGLIEMSYDYNFNKYQIKFHHTIKIKNQFFTIIPNVPTNELFNLKFIKKDFIYKLRSIKTKYLLLHMFSDKLEVYESKDGLSESNLFITLVSL